MRTYTASLQESSLKESKLRETRARSNIFPTMSISIRDMLAFLGALTTATGIVLLTVWMVGMGIDSILGASTWGLGFAFLGLAVDSRGLTAYLQSSTGVALLGLACLQNFVSPDFTIASGVLLATWVLVVMYRQLR
jgi:hypothetical protein